MGYQVGVGVGVGLGVGVGGSGVGVEWGGQKSENIVSGEVGGRWYPGGYWVLGGRLRGEGLSSHSLSAGGRSLFTQTQNCASLSSVQRCTDQIDELASGL